jgi:SNF2 family DNA or RNA helicase
MLVIKNPKALVLQLKDPTRVTSVIPSAKQFTLRGKDLVAIPHKLDEVKVLNNMGIEAPSPVLYHYDWPGRFTPFDHQKQTVAALTMNRKIIVLNEIGTGKTKSAMWAADYLIQQGIVKKVLIMSPLSTLERVWGDEVFTGFPNRRHLVLHGSAQRRKKLLAQDADFYIINHDGFNIIAEQAQGMFDLVIVDEAAVYRNPSSVRYRTLKKWMENNPNTLLWLMTGTPTPNEPTEAWALAKLIDSPHLKKSYTAFREDVMQKVALWKWVPRPDAMETVQRILQPAIRFTRDECFDLPDTVYQTRRVPLTVEQKKYYDQMLKHLIAEVAVEKTSTGTITAVNEAVKVQKLVQIACGVAYNDNGESIELDCGPRVQAVKEVIEEAGGKVIVFVPLTGTLHMLERELAKHWTCGVVNGEVSATKRNQIFQDFQHAPHPKVLIAHPGTMAHGLTLTAASTTIWYGPINSNETYVQANGRVERIGKRHVTNVVHIEATDLEHRAYERLESKQSMQGLLLDLIQEGMK